MIRFHLGHVLLDFRTEKKDSKPPPAPDPYAVSGAQTASNQNTAAWNQAMARGNTYTPLGTQTYEYRGTDPGTGAPMWDETVSLTPDAQALLTQQMAQERQLGDIAGGMMSQVQGAYGQPIDAAGVPALQGAPQLQGIDRSGLPALQSSLSVDGPELRGAGTGSVSSSGLPRLYGADDLLGERQQAQDALYRRQAAYLDPQWAQRDTAFRSRMANQGVAEGSEAWRNALDDESRARSFDYGQARDAAITGGLGEMQGLAGIAQGNRGQLFGERATAAGIQNQAAGIQNSFNLGARQAALAEGLARLDANNQARAQGFGERLTATESANRDALAAAGFDNSARAQGLQELFALRNQPLNEYNALRSASQVQMPQFQSAGDAQMGQTDVSGNVYNSYQGQLVAYNAQQASRNSLVNGLLGLGGMIGGGWLAGRNNS